MLDHVGLEDSDDFTADMIEDISGYQGHYNRTLEPVIQEAMDVLDRHFDRPSSDLQRLLDTYFPHLHFQGLQPEL